jgi:17beta-estradiol 17-dehydrogenase / very-long-chain 3-oxoacyl-CoA reductase
MVSKFTFSDLDLEILVFFIGIYYLTKWSFRTVKAIHRSFYGTKCTPERYGHESWAIITGATGGLGKSCAIELASRGFNILIISNNVDKMKQTETEITSRFSNR